MVTVVTVVTKKVNVDVTRYWMNYLNKEFTSIVEMVYIYAPL